MLVPGRNAYRLAESLSSTTNIPIVNVQSKLFPDGEHYIRVLETEKVKGSTTIVVETMYPGQNDAFIEILMLLDAVRRLNPRKIVLIVPYLAYSRQDKVFLEGEPVTGKIVLETMLKYADHMLVYDIHSLKLISGKTSVKNLLFFDLMVAKILEKTRNPVILAPDKGALHRARFVAEKLGLEYDYLIKHRDRITGEVAMEPKTLDIRDRDVVIIDDIISTGGTIAKAARRVLESGARRVYVAATHALLINNAIDKLKKACVEKLYTIDSLGIRHEDPFIEYVDYYDGLWEAVLSIVGE